MNKFEEFITAFITLAVSFSVAIAAILGWFWALAHLIDKKRGYVAALWVIWSFSAFIAALFTFGTP